MAVAGRPEDGAVVGGTSLFLRLRVYREGDTYAHQLRDMQGLCATQT